MRVCHVASGDLWAGAEVQIWTLVGYLRRQPGVEVSAVVLNEGELARRLRALDVETVVLDERRLGALAIVAGLTRTFRRLDPHVVHTHRYKENVLGSLAAAAARVPASVRTVHGLTERYRGLRRLRMALYTRLDHAAIRARRQTVIAVSADMARVLARALGASVRQIPNAIALPVSASGPSATLPGARATDLVIGTAARFVPVKALDVLLEALARVCAREPRARGLLLGDGPLLPALRARAAALGLEGRVLFPGHQPEVAPYLQALDVFVLSSWSEGLPMSLLEAMAAGKPIVATAVGGVPEVVRDGREGRLVPPGAPDALADALLELTADADGRRAMGAAARARVEEGFSIAATGPQYVTLYHELARDPTGHGARRAA